MGKMVETMQMLLLLLDVTLSSINVVGKSPKKLRDLYRGVEGECRVLIRTLMAYRNYCGFQRMLEPTNIPTSKPS